MLTVWYLVSISLIRIGSIWIHTPGPNSRLTVLLTHWLWWFTVTLEQIFTTWHIYCDHSSAQKCGMDLGSAVSQHVSRDDETQLFLAESSTIIQDPKCKMIHWNKSLREVTDGRDMQRRHNMGQIRTQRHQEVSDNYWMHWLHLHSLK